MFSRLTVAFESGEHEALRRLTETDSLLSNDQLYRLLREKDCNHSLCLYGQWCLGASLPKQQRHQAADHRLMRVALAALAVAVVGLVILLASQYAPALGELLLHLLGLAF